MKDIKELNIWRDISLSSVGRFNIAKRSVLPKLNYRFKAMPMKISASYFMDINKLILKLI